MRLMAGKLQNSAHPPGAKSRLGLNQTEIHDQPADHAGNNGGNNDLFEEISRRFAIIELIEVVFMIIHRWFPFRLQSRPPIDRAVSKRGKSCDCDRKRKVSRRCAAGIKPSGPIHRGDVPGQSDGSGLGPKHTRQPEGQAAGRFPGWQ